MTSKNKTVLWDNDGVLVDTEHLYFQAGQEILAEVGYHLTKKEFQDISLKRGQGVIGLAETRGVGPETIKRLRAKRNDRYTELLYEKTAARNGIEECLAQLRPQVQMGIVTSSRKDHFEVIHKITGLLKYIDFVLTRDGFQESKPSPDAYLTALKKWELKKENCLVVEDSERGVRAAKAAGLICLAVPHELSAGGDFSQADKICPDIPAVQIEIETWLKTSQGLWGS